MAESDLRPVLIDDVIATIVGQADSSSQKELTRLALISRAALTAARKSLYLHPILYNLAACRSFATTLQNHNYLATFVRGLTLRFEDRPVEPYQAGDGSMLQSIFSLERIESLCLHDQAASIAGNLLHLMQNPQRLRHLIVTAITGSDDTLSWPPTSRTMRPFKSLSSVTMKNMTISIGPKQSRCLFPITELNLNHVDISSGHIEDMTSDWSDLRTLKVSGTFHPILDWDVQVREVVRSCTATLENFHYSGISCPSNADGILDRDFAACPALRALRLRCTSFSDYSLSQLPLLFPRLQELSVIGTKVSFAADSWIDFLKCGSLPFLRSLSVPSVCFLDDQAGSGPVIFTKWAVEEVERVIATCHQRGVKFDT